MLNEINWEQRRYELVKVILPVIMDKNETCQEPEALTGIAIAFADLVITELREKYNGNQESL